MTTLAPHSLQAQQTALVSALFAAPGQRATAQAALPDHLKLAHAQGFRGLRAYEANGHALAERSLRAAFPTIDMMLGVDNFNALARDLWHQHPPTRGDLALWGADLPAFLERSASLSDTPYLGDVARAEWALHRAATAADTQPDPSSLSRLATEDPATLSLTFAPGTLAIHSRNPVASLVLSHREGEPSLGDAARLLREGRCESALVWRVGWRPRITACSAASATFVQAMQNGHALDAALSQIEEAPMPESTPFDFTAWLTDALASGLVTAVCNAPTTTP